MKKLILCAVALSLSGCATTAGLSPCEKAILAKMAAEKILYTVCPLSAEPPPVVKTIEEEGVY